MDSFELSIRSNVKEIQKKLSDFAYKQIPFATATALTALAKEVQQAERKQIEKTLDRPTPFTLNSVGVQGARKDRLQAMVFVKDIAAAYLEPFEVGGVHKLIGSGRTWLNPKDKALLNQFGNLPKSKLAALRGRKDIFIGKVKSKSGEEISGVWQRPVAAAQMVTRTGKLRTLPKSTNTSGKLKLLVRFGDAIPVKQRLHYRERAQKLVNSRFNAVFGAALAKAMASAR